MKNGRYFSKKKFALACSIVQGLLKNTFPIVFIEVGEMRLSPKMYLLSNAPTKP